MVVEALAEREASGRLADIGCGTGGLFPFVRERFSDYVGLDAVRYESFPREAKFCQTDLNNGRISLSDSCVDVAVAVEVIEHLENPRRFLREMARLVRPGGWIIVTTPNQLSFLSLLTLVIKHRFSAFQDVHYPAHITALLEIDLVRIAAECGLHDVSLVFSCSGRIVLTPWHFPKFLARRMPRALSDNLLLIGRK
jgi:2-polyprenyl-3-methyl-5-hydroxy-6-metoxy-1,4-benzoquinol methylase